MIERRYRAWHLGARRVMDVLELHFDPAGGIESLVLLENADTHRPRSHPADRDAVELMVSTGMFDAHGREIYEGDILRTERGLVTVYWSSDDGTWMASLRHLNWCTLADLSRQSPLEIAGNVWESPALLY